MSFFLVLLLAFASTAVECTTLGNSLVTCTACQAVQAKDFSCNVNCQVANGNNEEMITNGVITKLLQKINQLTEALNLLNNTVDVRLQKLEVPRDAFTATSYKISAQNTAEADTIVGAIYKFPTEVLDQFDSYDPATGVFTAQQNGTYNLLMITRSQPLSQAALSLWVEKPGEDPHFVCRANSFSEREDSICSSLYELQVGDKAYPKGALNSGKMHMSEKFGSFQAYLVY